MSDYYISGARYRELKYFCLQYEEKKQRLSGGYGVRGIEYNGMPGGGEVGKPTEDKALSNLKLQKEVEMIEQTAIEAASEFYQQLLRNVAHEVPYEFLDIPICEKDFYGMRRYFFYLLSLKR